MLKDNAQYLISIARKLGATVFIIWEQIANVKEKFLFIFAASLYRAMESQKI